MTTSNWTTVSHHFLRRRARLFEQRMEREYPSFEFKVIRAKRGPYRWYVAQRTNTTSTR